MYSNAERDARRRELWDISHWMDWVESGASRAERLARLAEVPPWAQAEVTRKCQRRAALAAGRRDGDAP
jgi:hypothetical protein